jgi:hypothetical protein
MGERGWPTAAIAACAVIAALLLPAWALATAPPNDDFPGTPVYGSPVSIDTDNTGATAQIGGGEQPHGGQIAAHSIWYQWTAPAGVGLTDVTTCGQGTPPTDTRLAVYTGDALASLHLIESNDDNPDSCSFSSSVSSLVTFTPVPLTTYSIALDTNVAMGPFAFIIRPHPGPHVPVCTLGGVPVPCDDTGLQAAAVRKCKHKKHRKARKKCFKKAYKLPV